MIQPADILLFRVAKQSSTLDKLIGWGQKVIHQAPTLAEYCHAALVGPDYAPGQPSMIEARWPRVHRIPLDIADLEKRNPVEVYRVKDMTPAQIEDVLGYAMEHVGVRYDMLAILTFGVLQLGNCDVCSQLDWESFTPAGIALCPFQGLLSPDDLAAAKGLIRIQ